ncbi:EF-P 5-aminopentanol modification-associated protein YfmH [Weissella bombi]|uniref:EF-P 5-aminopentanol modification-associated protein YfmH n=1 Tax=Weissella bombi TaxID=1505725 RepID=UPI003AF2A82B
MANKTHDFLPVEHHITLDNGLHVHLLPRPEFHQIVGVVGVDYGARDSSFMQNDKKVTQPAGIAHFVEHRLFAQPDHDAFARLSDLGAIANAFTTQTRTSYYVATAVDNWAPLQELLTFTQEPYFDLPSVQREQEIITQEIDMYEDDINSRVYRMILARLYPGDPLGLDIAGTAESVHQITPEQLNFAFAAFYQPQNMDVVVTGAFDEQKMLAFIKQSPAGQRKSEQLVTKITPTLQPINTDTLELELPVARNKVVLGQRWELDFDTMNRRDILKTAIVGSLAIDLVFGDFSPVYMTWYNDGLIDDNFSAEFDTERQFAYITVVADTAEPTEVVDQVSYILANLVDEVTKLQAYFELVKNGMLSRLINKLNELEEIAIRFEGQTFDDATLQVEIATLQALTFTDMLAVLKTIPASDIASIIIRSDMTELC